jgi:hypothetical protein
LEIHRKNDDFVAFSDHDSRVVTIKEPGQNQTFERISNDQSCNELAEGQILSVELIQNSSDAIYNDGTSLLQPARPTAHYALELEALILPNLEDIPRFKDHRIRIYRWTLWLNSDGLLATASQIRRNPNCLFRLCHNRGKLCLTTPPLSQESQQTQEFDLPLPITQVHKIGKATLEPLPQGCSGLGCLRLNTAALAHKKIRYTLDEVTRCIGSPTADPLTQKANPRITLNQLAQPQSLEWNVPLRVDDQRQQWTFANLCLSGEHAKVQIIEDAEEAEGLLRAEPMGPRYQLQRLDGDNCCPQEPLVPGGNEGALKLSLGNGLLLRHVLLRLVDGRAPDQVEVLGGLDIV